MHHRIPVTTTLFTLLLAALFVLSASNFSSTTAADTKSVAATTELTPAQKYARSAIKRTNFHRIDHNLGKVSANGCLHKWALKQAKAVAKAQELYHQDLSAVASDCNLRAASENVAYGYATGRSVVSQGWMHSEGHKENILRSYSKLVGVAAVKDSEGRWWVAQVFGTR